MNCLEAKEVLLSPIATLEARSQAQQHVLSCALCAEVGEHSRVSELVRERMNGHVMIRAVLAMVGLLQLSLAIPWLLGSDGWWGHGRDAADLHVTRDGAIAMVVVTCALVSAWSRRAAWFSVLPMALAVSFQIVSAIYDDSQHRLSSGFEIIHLLYVVIFGLILLELRPVRRR